MAWLFLTGAILFEVSATLALRVASTGRKVWFIGVGVGYLVAFTMLVQTLANGMPLGVAYGIWAAAGVALTAVLSKILFGEPLTGLMGLGIILIVGGVLLIETGAAH
ncbi:small multidrug resistance pump [Promicromonospora umidemergens]|nr:SMR family transporter [Promicromonospora umidemergens]MCP2283131.1 small multidrug resistance pump [Promicromonospora umidemergens]